MQLIKNRDQFGVSGGQLLPLVLLKALVVTLFRLGYYFFIQLVELPCMKSATLSLSFSFTGRQFLILFFHLISQEQRFYIWRIQVRGATKMNPVMGG